MYLSNYDRVACCGCGSCQQICPSQCITMKLLDDGFFYPAIDEENCVHCDNCKKVCPIHQPENKLLGRYPRDCYYGWHKDESIRMQSTSGGIFSAIAEWVLENSNSCVYGALYDDDWRICHKGVDSLVGLDRLRQSKYVQSSLGSCYSEIQERLNRHELILFCGTPCQVNGLQRFLRKDYEKLLLVDFVCHGVSSPLIFEAYVQHIEKKQGSRLKRFRFRDKVSVGNVPSLGHTTMVFENSRKISSECNLYLQAYINGLMQRVSCEMCPFASRYRMSDITLGDFWGIEDAIPMLKDQYPKGISLILSNTEKGHVICQELLDRIHLVKTELLYAFNGKNKQFEIPVSAKKSSQQLYNDVKKIGVQLALAKALGLRTLLLMYYGWCKVRMKAYLPKTIYRWMVFFKRSLIVYKKQS